MKKYAANLLVFSGALVVAFCLAEISARFFLPAPQQVVVSSWQPLPAIAADHPQKELHIGEHPDEGGVYVGTPTGKRLRPHRNIIIENHRLSHQKVLIQTNSLGYRNPEVSKKEPGEKHGPRILFLGDSVTFQDFLNEDDTFVRQVEKLAQASGKNWQTINAGVGAISLKTEVAILQESGLGLQPDVVVLDFYLNDFQESRGVEIIHLPWLLQHSYFAYHLVDWLNQQRGQHLVASELSLDDWKTELIQYKKVAPGYFNKSPEAFNQMVLDNFHDYGAVWSEGAWQHMEPLFVELKQLSQQHHFKLVIVGFPVYQQVYTEFVDDTPQQQLKRVARELDIPVLDLLPVFRAEALRLRDPSIYATEDFYTDLFYDQCHHTAAGSALIAREITHFLQTQLPD